MLCNAGWRQPSKGLADIRPIKESKSAAPIVATWQMPGAVPQAGSCAAASKAKKVHHARIPATSTKNAVVPVFLFASARRSAHRAWNSRLPRWSINDWQMIFEDQTILVTGALGGSAPQSCVG
jgi:hypothetical protein